MYSLNTERREKFLLSLRTSIPIVLLTALLVYVIFTENRSLAFNLFLGVGALFIAVYYIFLMIFRAKEEKILDEITDTFDRHYFEKYFSKLAQKKNYLILLSVDNIREINERYGLENGDRVLREFAKIVDGFFSLYFGSVPIARLKAGDFLLLVRSNAQLQKVLEKFLQTYDNSFINNIEIKLYAAYQPLNHKSLKFLIDRLYEDLYFCKGECKKETNKGALYSKKRENISDFDKLIEEIVKQKHFSLLFQPVYNLKTESFDFAEIIVKLLDDEGKLIHPSQYIPTINRLGLENAFDIALTEALLEIIVSHKLIMDFSYCFNISPYSVRNRRFTQRFFETFEKYDVSKRLFIIKLYENSIYKDVKYFRSVIQGYQTEGFSIAFDNFGACNASIEYIKSIDVDYLFFDKFFTRNIENIRYRTLLQTWIDALHTLGMKSVVKFIDNQEILERVKTLNVDFVEGFAIAKPMESKEFLEWRSKNALW
ncbi:diguanylate cyclase/phosphodiesterase [Nitratiruptor sp. YY08-26]|uniref:EAL domain-containing protein n=1 Tax=unclassified Nitratiruptor TaxID=2624044 RepID=UPI0019161D20|nr:MULTISPECIES: GGDEF domain-containing protein [unclassified Nitratiruptor]BCD61171.1 diguanylate cyclase/phosphodiesterase [Nitratiruptor sp. YY08-13]BCD65104.1 diguanylate cyclase/phosphodiesterase [Nitratiruptor sp. YY08-26]